MARALASGPLGPWRAVDGADPSPSQGPDLAYGSYRAFASLYRELARLGIPPPVAKQMEVWEAASVLGVGFTDPEVPGQPAQDSHLKGVPQSDLDMMRARLAAAAGEGPPPQVSATNPETVTAMMNTFANG